MKKIILTMCIVLSVFLILGCSKKSKTEEVNLVWYQWFDAETHRTELVPIIEEFRKTHPNINVELAVSSNEAYWDRLALDIASGAEGDIITLDTGNGLSGYYSQRSGGAFIALDDYIKGYVLEDGTKLEEDIYLIDSVKQDGKIVALPYFMYNAPMTAYSKAKLSAAGLVPEDLSRSWDSYYDACVRMSSDSNGDGTLDVYGWGHPSYIETLSRWWHMHWLWTAGGGIFPKEQPPFTPDRLIFNSPENAVAVEYMKKLFSTTAPQGLQKLTDLHAMFANGSVSTVQIATWTVANLQAQMSEEAMNTDFGLAPFPAYSDTKPAILTAWGNPLAISSNCKYPKEAFEFIAFMHSKFAQRMVMRRGSPTSKLVYDEYAKNQPIQAGFIEACAPYEMRLVPDILQWNQFDRVIQESISSALLGTRSVQEALDWGQNEMKKILEN